MGLFFGRSILPRKWHVKNGENIQIMTFRDVCGRIGARDGGDRPSPDTPQACYRPRGSLLMVSSGLTSRRGPWVRLARASLASIAGWLDNRCVSAPQAGIDDVGGRVTDDAGSPVAVGWSDRVRAMAFQLMPGRLRLRLQTWVALATANGQARGWAGDERRRRAEHGGVGCSDLPFSGCHTTAPALVRLGLAVYILLSR